MNRWAASNPELYSDVGHEGMADAIAGKELDDTSAGGFSGESSSPPPAEDTSPEETGAGLPVSADEAAVATDPASGEESSTSLTVLNPTTGEVLALADASDEELMHWLADRREWEQNVRLAAQQVSDEVLKRMDRLDTYTLRGEDIEITGGREKTIYNAEELDASLEVLERAKKITHAERRAAVEEVTTLKAKATGIKQLLTKGGEVAELVKSLEKPDPKPRRVSVKVKP